MTEEYISDVLQCTLLNVIPSCAMYCAVPEVEEEEEEEEQEEEEARVAPFLRMLVGRMALAPVHVLALVLTLSLSVRMLLLFFEIADTEGLLNTTLAGAPSCT